MKHLVFIIFLISTLQSEAQGTWGQYQKADMPEAVSNNAVVVRYKKVVLQYNPSYASSSEVAIKFI